MSIPLRIGLLAAATVGAALLALVVFGALVLLGAALSSRADRRTPVAVAGQVDGRHLHYIRGLPGHTHYVHATDVCWCRNPTHEDEHRP